MIQARARRRIVRVFILAGAEKFSVQFVASGDSAWSDAARGRGAAPKHRFIITKGNHLMKKLFRPLALALLAAAFSMTIGCATVTRGTTQTVAINSVPSGATVSMSNGERCETPCIFKLKRKYPVALEVCKPGYTPVNNVLTSQMSSSGGWAMAGNVIIGGLIGLGIDAGTGAYRDLTPNPVNITLAEEVQGCAAPAFPVVPGGGQTVEQYQKWKSKQNK